MADQTFEPPSGGIVAIALNGVPIYGAQEAQEVVGNAVSTSRNDCSVLLICSQMMN